MSVTFYLSSRYFYVAGSVDGALGGGYYPPSANGPVTSGIRKPNVTTTTNMVDSGAF